jgi:putative endonuclease
MSERRTMAACVARSEIRPVMYGRAMQRHGAPGAGSELPNKTERGASAEQRAVELLVRKGYRIVERNYRSKLGELDIIARDGSTLVFVEVRSRCTARFGSALEAVGRRKQVQVSRVAMQYLVWRRPSFSRARFDVVAITGHEVVHVVDAWRLGLGG